MLQRFNGSPRIEKYYNFRISCEDCCSIKQDENGKEACHFHLVLMEDLEEKLNCPMLNIVDVYLGLYPVPYGQAASYLLQVSVIYSEAA